MKILLTITLFLFFAGCSKDETFVFLMEASFVEQFSNACNEQKECISAVDKYMDSCFDRKLALAAIEADSSAKRKINTKHILKVQTCLSDKAGMDYWKSIDMPEYILSQVQQAHSRPSIETAKYGYHTI